MSREDMKFEMNDLIKNLKSMAEEFEELLAEMDNLTDNEFDAKSEHIQDTYSKYGIELF